VNALGPATLTKGKYHLVVHPDQDSQVEQRGEEVILFGLDVLLEKSDIGESPNGDFDVIIEEIELCGYPSIPDNFNGPGFLHPLAGNSVRVDGRYRLTELLEGTSVKFELQEPSRVTFYMEVNEGLTSKARLERVKGTYTSLVTSNDLNKGEETFLRQDGGFDHRAII